MNQSNIDATASANTTSSRKPTVDDAFGIILMLAEHIDNLTAQCAAHEAEIAGLRDQLTDIRQDQAA